MAIIMTRECGYGPLLDNYIKITDLTLAVNDIRGVFLNISLKAYFSLESRDYEKLKEYFEKNNLLLNVVTVAQAQFMNTYWAKPDILDMGTMVLSFPVKLKDFSNKTTEEIFSEAYKVVKESREGWGFKVDYPKNVLEDHIESNEDFVKRVVTPFIEKFNSLGDIE